MSPLSSLSTRPAVNDSPTEERAHAHSKEIHNFLRLERRVLNGREPSRPARVIPAKDPAPHGAEAILAALAVRFPAGQELSVVQIAEAAGCSQFVADRVRRWAKSVDRWPYTNGHGFCGRRPAGGEQ